MSRWKLCLILMLCFSFIIILVNWFSPLIKIQRGSEEELQEDSIGQYYANCMFRTSGTLDESELSIDNVTLLIPMYRQSPTVPTHVEWFPVRMTVFYYVLHNPANKSFGDTILLSLNSEVDEDLIGKQVEVSGILRYNRLKIETRTRDFYIVYVEKLTKA